jgi:Ca2+-binding RTX toxin-like protein
MAIADGAVDTGSTPSQGYWTCCFNERLFPMIELLDFRRLLSVSFDPSSGTLAVQGEPEQCNNIEFSEEVIDHTAHVIRVNVNGEVSDFDAIKVKHINVTGGDKADVVIVGSIDVDADIRGGKGHDTLSSGDGNDVLDGQGGEDYVFGRNGNDTITGGIGYDIIIGGEGDDTLIPLSDRFGDDTVSGSPGRDTVDYSAESTDVIALAGKQTLPTKTDDRIAKDIEVLIGGSGNDDLEYVAPPGSTIEAVSINGGAGNDTIVGGSASDTLVGGPGNDSISGLDGDDSIFAKDGEKDSIDGGSGTDIVDQIDNGVDVVSNTP